jgi:hypothetical protein
MYFLLHHSIKGVFGANLIYVLQCNTHYSMHREAEKQYLSSLRHQPMTPTFLYLAKVYLKLDQPQRALEVSRVYRVCVCECACMCMCVCV